MAGIVYDEWVPCRDMHDVLYLLGIPGDLTTLRSLELYYLDVMRLLTGGSISRRDLRVPVNKVDREVLAATITLLITGDR